MTTITTSNRLFIKGVSTEARLDDIEQIVRQSCGGYGNFVKVELAPYRVPRGVTEPPRFTNAIAHFAEWNFSKDDMSLREMLMTGGYVKIYHTDATRTTPARFWKAYLFDPTRTTTQDQDRAQDVDRRNAAQMQSRPPQQDYRRDRLPERRREPYEQRDRLPERREQYDNRDRLPERRREQYDNRDRLPELRREQSYDNRRDQSYDNRDRLPERRSREQSYDNREHTPNYRRDQSYERRDQSYERRGYERSESRDRSPDHRRVVREGRYRQETDRDYVSNVKPAPKRPPLARQQPAIRQQPVVEQKKQELDFEDDCSSCTNSQDAVHLNDVHEAMDYGEVPPSRKRKVKIISSRMMEKITEEAKAAKSAISEITSSVSALSL